MANEKLEPEVERLQDALIYLAVKCRQDLDCVGSRGDGTINGKAVINWVHDYCSNVLEEKSL
jgi:hypothetical protein